jgi:hypothetical protein
MSSAREVNIGGNLIDCVINNEIITPGQIAVMLNNLPTFATTTPPGGFSIVGPSNICYYQDWYDFSIATIPGATQYSWFNSEDYPMSGVNTQNMSLLPDNGAGFFTIALLPNCGAPELYKEVNVLRSYNNESLPVNGPTGVILNANYVFSTNSYNGVNYSWSIPSGWTINYGQGTYILSVSTGSSPSSGNVSVTTTPCNTSNYKYVTVGGGGPHPFSIETLPEFVIYPNPVMHEFEIIDNYSPNSELEITIYNLLSGNRVLSSKDQCVVVSSLPKGVYVIEIIKDGKLTTKKIIKQ